MAPQHDLEISTGDANTGSTVRAELNSALQALGSCQSGATEPTTTYAYMFWADTSTGLLKQRNAADNAWITWGYLATPTLLSSLLTAQGDLPYASAANTPARLAKGTAGQILRMNSGATAPEWATVYRTIFIPAGAMIPAYANSAQQITSSYASDTQQIDYWAFDGATEEYVFFNLVMPEDWDIGTIKAKFYFIPASGCSAGDTVEWEIGAGAKSNDDTFDAAIGTTQVISDTILGGAAADLHVSGATPALTVGGTPALGDWVSFKVSRNVGGTDDMTEDAYLLGVVIQYAVKESAAAW